MVTAVAAFVDARSAGGEFLVRMEDIDESRCMPGADAEILRQLELHGLCWDGPVVYQSQRHELYRDALRLLNGHTYPCACSRKDMEFCRCAAGLPPGKSARAIRFRGEDEIEDFVILRADGIWSYQLAVVVDDADQEITHVVRGADLEDSTPRQNLLQQRLGFPVPHYRHVPLVVDAQGNKLSKQNHAPAVPDSSPEKTIAAALQFLGHSPPADIGPEILRWVIENPLHFPETKS